MPSVPPRLALALVVHGSGIARSTLPVHRPGRRPTVRGISLLRVRIAVIAPVWFPVPPAGYGGIELVVVAAGRRPGRRRPRRHAVRERRIAHQGASSSRPCPSRPTRASSATPGTTRSTRCRRTCRSTASTSCTITPASSGRCAARCCAAAAGRAHAARTVDRPDARCSTSLVGRARAPRRDQRRASAPRTPTSRTPAIVHNGIDLDAYPYRARQGRLPRLHRAREPRQGTGGSDPHRAAGRPAAADDPEARRAAGARRTSSTRSNRCSATTSSCFENVSHETKVELLGARPRDDVPDPVARAVRARHGRGDGVRHAGRDDELGRGARARRRRRHRLPPRRRRRPRRTRSAASTELDPAACRARVEERFSAAAMVRGLRGASTPLRGLNQLGPGISTTAVVLLQWPA